MTENPNRGPWIIAAAILLAAIMVVAVMLYLRSKDAACKNWQAEVQETMGQPLAGGDVNRAVFLVGERPDGCALP